MDKTKQQMKQSKNRSMKKSVKQSVSPRYLKSKKNITTITPVETSNDVVTGKSSNLAVKTQTKPIDKSVKETAVLKELTKKLKSKLSSQRPLTK